ncbi:MAG: hypothetical protein R3309_00170 [Reinekea sp.]|nr:hypothetical protein [Reinekea sp.]
MSQKEEVRNIINAIYDAAGINYKFRGEVTEMTAEVLGKMISEIRSCTTALNWVPRPTGGKATISWIARNLGSSFVRDLEKKNISLTCGRRVLLGLRSELEYSGIM